MPRPVRRRRMNNPPCFRGYKPIEASGIRAPVLLNYDEYESIRLSDYELLDHVAASVLMSISRPTFTRIYESARRKIAQAIVTGAPIIFEGGKVYFDSEWFLCNSCGCYFNHLHRDRPAERCSLCNSDKIEQYSNK
ncbi:MAG: DUF134 domain-containing protein [Bacteroidales bacterium]|nr:DUF134 domain-containing protein [Bacteroidales bacterium]